MLERLKAARALLATAYVPWTTDDGRGGHCQWGCLQQVGVRSLYSPEHKQIEEACRALFPELRGRSARRPLAGICELEKFDEAPAIFVNNHVGKEAILRAYDAAILDLEIAEATMPAEAPAAAAEIVGVAR